jgi:hypothetical protein
MFERLTVTKINNRLVLDTLAKSVQNTDELEYQLRGTRRENQELQMKLKECRDRTDVSVISGQVQRC